MGEHSVGPNASCICILGDRLGVSAFTERKPFAGWEKPLLDQTLRTVGIDPDSIYFDSVSWSRSGPSEADCLSCLERLKSLPGLRAVVPLGEEGLRLLCEKSSVEKWVASPLDSSRLPGIKVIPSYDFRRIGQDFSLRVYLQLAIAKAVEGAKYDGPWRRKKYNFRPNPSYAETMDILAYLRANPEMPLSVDIETGRGQINTLGFAWSAEDAIAINTLPDRLSADKHYALWRCASALLEKGRPLILQNNIYETQYFARYGISTRGVWHDTMWAQKFLWPEFKAALGNVGRFYTDEPYWKDDGKVSGEEEKKKDWGDIRDWQKHYIYNCKDTTGTYEAAMKQKEDLEQRGLDKVFYEYVMKLASPVQEMCLRGLPVSEAKRAQLEEQLVTEIQELRQGFPEDFNHRSWQQKQKFLEAKGYKIPTVRGKKTTNELGMKKLRLRHPEDGDIDKLLKISKKEKALSSYVRFKYEPPNVHYSMVGCSTETGRMNSGTDAWGGGFNAQTIPSYMKMMFDAPQGHSWIELDLDKAETWFVAYDSCDETLIKMLNAGADIHSHVAAEIFQKPVPEIEKAERQLGKKSGHGANYSMGVITFQESCLKEMDIVLNRKEATNVLESYHRLFPGIRRWHKEIEDRVKRGRKLTNPLGRERYFYGRLDPNTFREAYAYRPQSTVPDVTNHLMLRLLDQRDKGRMRFTLHLQKHDSILLCAPNGEVEKIAEFALTPKNWHPELILPAGRLEIPASCEVGKNLGELEEWAT